MATNSSQPAHAPERFTALNSDLAPAGPGIYAWYAHVPLGVNDWRPNLVDGSDAAASAFHRGLSKYASAHRPPPIELVGSGTYDLRWEGTLHLGAVTDARAGEASSLLGARMDFVMEDPDSRQRLLSLMRAAPPIFATPLYIGVATNLRARLGEHKRDYESAKAAIRSDPTRSAHMQFEGKSFGERLAGCGLTLDSVEVWVLQAQLHEPDRSAETRAAMPARVVAQAAEWILQRVFQPALGRK